MTNLHDPYDLDPFDPDGLQRGDLALHSNAQSDDESSMEKAGEVDAAADFYLAAPTRTGLELEASAWSEQPPLEPDMGAVQIFWEEARKVAGLTVANVLIGENPLGLIPPPVWQFQDPDHQAKQSSRFAQMVAQGIKHATSSAAWEYDPDALPHAGDMSIICDGAGRPVALVVTQEVQIVPFDQVDRGFVAAEGEDDLSVESWRLAHVRLLKGYHNRALDEPWPEGEPWPSDDMVLEHLTCLYPKPPARRKHLFG